MLGHKNNIIAQQAEHIKKLESWQESIQPVLPLALDLQAEISKELEPLSNPLGWTGDVVAAARETVRGSWIEKARRLAYEAILKAKGKDIMDQLINQEYAENAEKYYEQAQQEISANPKLVSSLRKRAIQEVLKSAQARVGEELSTKDADSAAEEAERIAHVQTKFHSMQQTGEVDVRELKPLFLPDDFLHIALQDPDHSQRFASVLLKWHTFDGAAGWLYTGYSLGERIRSDSGITDKKIPHNVFVEPESIIPNPQSGNMQYAQQLILGRQLAIKPINTSAFDIRTREVTSSGGYYESASYDYDPATIAVVTFAARPVRTWCDVEWATS